MRSLLRGVRRAQDRSDAKISSRASTYLAGSVATAALSFVSLPLATRILGPANYGVFALTVTIAGLGTTLATLGTSFYVGRHFAGGDAEARSSVVSALVARTTAYTAAWGVMAFATVSIIKPHLTALADLPLAGLL
ncbi:MAG: oligosaccharide flippase family protein, partial [Solirubrobacteraceae bacterium]